MSQFAISSLPKWVELVHFFGKPFHFVLPVSFCCTDVAMTCHVLNFSKVVNFQPLHDYTCPQLLCTHH